MAIIWGGLHPDSGHKPAQSYWCSSPRKTATKILPNHFRLNKIFDKKFPKSDFLTIISVACEIPGGLDEEQWNPRCLQKYFPFHFYNIFPELAMRLKVPLHHYLRGLWQSWLMQQSWRIKKIWNTKLGEELSYPARIICWHWCRELQIFALFARLNYFPSSLHLHSDFKLEKEFRRKVGRRR